MNFSKLKELVSKLGGVLVLDGDEPEFVILSYDNYEKLGSEDVPFSTSPVGNGFVEGNGIHGIDGVKTSEYDDQESVEMLNQEILVLKEEIRAKEEAELVENEQSTEPAVETIDLE